MSRITLAQSLAGWVGSTLGAPGHPGRDHCFQIRPQFRIPGAGKVDLLTLRHESGGPEHFRIDLWTILPGAVREKDVDGMLRRLQAFGAWYADLVEHAETQGFRPAHELSIRGNLAGRTVLRSPLVDLLSGGGSSIFLWSWTRTAAGIDLLPAYDRTSPLRAARIQLKALLDHLPWEDRSEEPERAAEPTRATC